MFQTIKNWFLYSSADITKYSLSLRAGIPFLAVLGFDKYVTPDQAETLIDSAQMIFIAIVEVITGATTAFGILRKITLTVRDSLQPKRRR